MRRVGYVRRGRCASVGAYKRHHVSMPMECLLLGGKEKKKKYRMTRGNEGNGISPHPFICVFVFALGAFFSSSKYPLVMALKLVRYIVHPHVLAFVNMYMNNTTYNTAIIAHHKQAAALYLLFHAYAFLW